MMDRILGGVALPLLLSLGCSGTGQDRVDIPLRASGVQPPDQVKTVDGELVTITRADLAFGPLYLCAGNTAGDLCDISRAEWLDTAVINTMSDKEVSIGHLTGVTGQVRSWMYDLGISSQLTRSEPYVLQAAEELGSASFVLEGLVTLQGVELPLSASLPIQQTETTELGIPVIRKGSGEVFSHEITGAESGLTLRFSPEMWVSRLDLGSIVEDKICEADGPSVVCQEHIELRCDEDGITESTRDCGETSEACLAGVGCADAIVLEEGSNAYRSLAIALATTGRPSFNWKN